jgi:hypothetical protein
MPTQCHLGQVIYVPTEHSRRRRVVLAYKPGHVLVWVAATAYAGQAHTGIRNGDC